jgi:hypothetical protein
MDHRILCGAHFKGELWASIPLSDQGYQDNLNADMSQELSRENETGNHARDQSSHREYVLNIFIKLLFTVIKLFSCCFDKKQT